MKYLMIIATCLTLSGCGGLSRIEAHYVGYSTICVNGVSYIQFTSGAALQVDKTGMPITC